MKGFERRQVKKGLTLPLLHLTYSIFHLSAQRLPCALCCAALVLLLCVALTSYKIRRIVQVARVPSHSN